MKKTNIAIILSGGIGKRFNGSLPKQNYEINNKSILELSLLKFLKKDFHKIIIVSHKKIIGKTKRNHENTKIKVVLGGKSRQDSVKQGLIEAKKYQPDNVLIHDSVRPFFSNNLLEKLVFQLNNNDCVFPILKINDSIRFIDKKNYKNVDRENVFSIQTPQGFNFKKIFNIYKKIEKNYTDDSIIAFENGIKISTIEGERDNFKITTREDYEYAKERFKKKEMPIRIGQGFDVHNFTVGNNLIILGVKIPFNKSLEGHSDADVGFHCIVDSILGAIGKGDIGDHFPPSDQKWKNKPSKFFMDFSKNLLEKEKFKINNIDVTLICEKPNFSKYKHKMRKSISDTLNLEIDKINVKATTTEKLGFVGRQEGIACQSVVSISKIDEIE